MAVIPDDQIYGWALNAGWVDPHAAQVATAIALAESGGDASATNHNINGSTDYGLWQINSIHSDILSSGQWSDPNSNSQMAYKVYSQAGNSFRPWVTYNTGKYLAFMPRAAKAESSVKNGIKSQGQKQLHNLQSGGNAFDALTDPSFWSRIAFAILGGILLLWSAMKMTGNNQLSQGTKSIVGAAAKVAVA